MSFALQRAQQVQEIAAAHAAGTPLVTDFMTQKNDIFARLTLKEDEWQLYRALAARIDAAGPAAGPRRLFCRRAPKCCLHGSRSARCRWNCRSRTPYLPRYAMPITSFFYHYDGTPVLTVNAEHLNPLESDADLALLVERIETMRGRKEFFVKGTSL